MEIKNIRYNWKLRSIINALIVILCLIGIITVMQEQFYLFVLVIVFIIILEIIAKRIKIIIMNTIKKIAIANDLKTDKIKKKNFKGFKGDENFINLMETKTADEFMNVLESVLQ